MKKKIISSIMALSVCLSTVVSAIAEQSINVTLNSAPITFDTAPQIINDRTMVPMRAIFEAIGANVNWDNGVITAVYGNKEMVLTPNSNTASITENDVVTEYTLDSAPVIINDRTLVPVRFVSEQLGLNVKWDAEALTVHLSQYEIPAAIMEVEGYGTIVMELYPEIAPITVDNFITLAKSGVYDGLIFHRVIEGFMIQGGGYNTNSQQLLTPAIKGEFASNGIENNLKHTRGVLSMARTYVKDSASCQFFIMHQDAPHLDGEYAAFGKVISGMEVVDAIAAVATDMTDKPLENIVIKSIIIEE